jgi:hypothetical protein
MFRVKKTSVGHAALRPQLKIYRNNFSAALIARELKYWTRLWFGLKLACHLWN